MTKSCEYLESGMNFWNPVGIPVNLCKVEICERNCRIFIEFAKIFMTFRKYISISGNLCELQEDCTNL